MPRELNETHMVVLVDIDGDRDKDLVVANASPLALVGLGRKV